LSRRQSESTTTTSLCKQAPPTAYLWAVVALPPLTPVTLTSTVYFKGVSLASHYRQQLVTSSV